MNYRRLYSHPKDKTKGILFDQSIKLNNYYAAKDYPEKLRIIKHKDDTGKVLVFLTNNFDLPASHIAQLYKHRWKIELFIQMDKATFKNKIILGGKVKMRLKRRSGLRSQFTCW